MRFLFLLAACTSAVGTEGTTDAPCYQFLKGGEALYFHRRFSPTKHLVRIGHCRSCGGNWDVCKRDAKVADEAFLKTLDAGTDFTCDMLRNTSCGNLTEASAAAVVSRSSPTAATWPLVILAILCWTGCAGALAWLLFTHGAAHFSGHKEESLHADSRKLIMMINEKNKHGLKLPLEDSEEEEGPLLPERSTCGVPCCSVRSIPETGGAEDFDIVTVGPDGFEVRPAGEEEFDVVTVSSEGFEVRPATPQYAFRSALGEKAMHTTILEPPMEAWQQQGMQTTILEQPPLGTHNHGMQTTILEQPPLGMNPTSAMQTTILEPPPI